MKYLNRASVNERTWGRCVLTHKRITVGRWDFSTSILVFTCLASWNFQETGNLSNRWGALGLCFRILRILRIDRVLLPYPVPRFFFFKKNCGWRSVARCDSRSQMLVCITDRDVVSASILHRKAPAWHRCDIVTECSSGIPAMYKLSARLSKWMLTMWLKRAFKLPCEYFWHLSSPTKCF